MSALRTDRPKNGGDNKVRDRIAYASKREKELLASGMPFAEAWDTIRAECRAGVPEMHGKPGSLSPRQRALLQACVDAPYESGYVPRHSYHPFVVASLEKRGLIEEWIPSGIYHGARKVRITAAGRAAIAGAAK